MDAAAFSCHEHSDRTLALDKLAVSSPIRALLTAPSLAVWPATFSPLPQAFVKPQSSEAFSYFSPGGLAPTPETRTSRARTPPPRTHQGGSQAAPTIPLAAATLTPEVVDGAGTEEGTKPVTMEDPAIPKELCPQPGWLYVPHALTYPPDNESRPLEYHLVIPQPIEEEVKSHYPTHIPQVSPHTPRVLLASSHLPVVHVEFHFLPGIMLSRCNPSFCITSFGSALSFLHTDGRILWAFKHAASHTKCCTGNPSCPRDAVCKVGGSFGVFDSTEQVEIHCGFETKRVCVVGRDVVCGLCAIRMVCGIFSVGLVMACRYLLLLNEQIALQTS